MSKRNDIEQKATKLVIELCKLLQRRLQSTIISNDDRSIFSIVLLVKIFNICQGIIVVHKKKQLIPLEILTRCLIENVCLLNKKYKVFYVL